MITEDDDLVLVVKLSTVHHLEVYVDGRFVHTHQAKTESNHEVEASDDDENDADDDGHGTCGQDGLRAEWTDHTETSLTSDDGGNYRRHPGEAEETSQVVIQYELKHRPKPVLKNNNQKTKKTNNNNNNNNKKQCCYVHR